MAHAAGIQITWQDISDLSEATPLLARVYPNGLADVNHFHAAGGLGFLIRELLDAGLLHEDVQTIWGEGLRPYAVEARLGLDGGVIREAAPRISGDEKVLTTFAKPFQPTGGLRVLAGNIGHAIIKTSAVKPERRLIEAPAIVLDSQQALNDAFKAGQLDRDFVAVIRFQGPKANGMPELHKLTTILGVLQDRGHKVALVTDGRMSGASGKVPAAIHVTPEALEGGVIGRIRDGDTIRLDADNGTLEVLAPTAELAVRKTPDIDLSANEHGFGRELFAGFRQMVGRADHGASAFGVT
jgi:phosphogluconate dehydratase